MVETLFTSFCASFSRVGGVEDTDGGDEGSNVDKVMVVEMVAVTVMIHGVFEKKWRGFHLKKQQQQWLTLPFSG